MFEPFPGNYVWNLSVNLALCMGGAIGEIDAANRPVIEAAKHGTDAGTAAFFESWSTLAHRLNSQAEVDSSLGHSLSASEKYRRACVYYMTAERMQKHGFEPREAAYQLMLQTMWRSVETGKRNVERVEIPYQGASYPALLIRALGRDHESSPCMVHTNGLDSVKEMVYWSGIADALAARGISTLILDHPGVGEALRLRYLAGRYDSEAWVSPAVDVLSAMPDIDADRIGIMGWSLGGYYAPRAAAFDDRIALCVSWGANHCWGELQKRRLQKEGENPVPHYWEHVQWVFGKTDLADFLDWAPSMSLDGVAEKIRVPYLITHGSNDRQIPLEDARRSYSQATASRDRELKIFTERDGGVEHASADNMHPAIEFISDWIADRFVGRAN